jgi:hypothetical protein
MFEDDVLAYPPDVDSWKNRAEELLELLSRLPLEVEKANRRYGRDSISLLLRTGALITTRIQGTKNLTYFLCSTDKSVKILSLLNGEIAKMKTEEEKLKKEIVLGEKLNQELKESETLQELYNFMSYLKISGYPVVGPSLTHRERNLENITYEWGWTSRIRLGGGILKTPGYVGICITPQGALMLENFLKMSENK